MDFIHKISDCRVPIGKRNFRRNSKDVYDFILDPFWLVACVHCVKKFLQFLY